MRLKSIGYKVAVEKTAQSALSMATCYHPDVVLMDINLPDGNGFDIAIRMQANSTMCSTPVIFLTASTQAGLQERATNLDAIALLKKPFNSAELIDAIEVSQYSTPKCSAKHCQPASY